MKSEIEGMRLQKVKLVKRMREDQMTFKRQQAEKEKRIKQLRKKEMTTMNKFTKLKITHEKQQAVLKRKREQAAGEREREKEREREREKHIYICRRGWNYDFVLN